eukprot:TRINITY_DN1902_c0_g1_i27.p3 TRINITY_DN1902_c0_g1~~TRINITY_DN1902_c0_g1_i27.p3  ORF type:complete len:128 (-),score=23.95 TRINITY_DN1902_c0_g1_i27:189-572(-)
MPVYSTCIAAACVSLAECGFLPVLGMVFAWMQWMAALMDARENLGMLVILVSGAKEDTIHHWGEEGVLCTYGKFIIFLLGFTYSCVGGCVTRCCRGMAHKGKDDEDELSDLESEISSQQQGRLAARS